MRKKVLVSLASLGGLGAVLALAWFVSARLDGQEQGGAAKDAGGEHYNAPRTAWGDPDLQGQWNSQTSTPLERPQTGVRAEKDSLSEEEAESLEAAHIANADRPPAAGDPGTYNSFWFDRGKGLSRPSLIIDPPDGRVPAYTPVAEQRLAAARAARATRGPADSYADLPPWTRCITRGWNGIGSNYSSNSQIFQSPGYVVFYLVAMFLIFSHLWHGLSSAAQSLGVDHPAWTPGVLLAGRLLSVAIGGGFFVLPIVTFLISRGTR